MTPLAWMRLRCRSRLTVPVLVALALVSCAPAAGPPRVTVRWVMGVSEPRFDPDGPPHAARWALERWMSFGLTALDSAGTVVPAAAERWQVSADGLTWTFWLRDSLVFTDGTPCTSADLARALAAGLARPDHATREWLLGALEGVDRVRVRKPLPALGIATPDPRSLVVRLARPDPTLAHRLALPGVSTAWRSREPGLAWTHAVGLGPYAARAGEPARSLTLVRASGTEGPDTLAVRYAVGAPRVRALLRAGRADLVWPLPPALLDEPLPAGVARREAPARPARALVLVLRADTPPTHRLPARAAVAHALNRRTALGALGAVARPVGDWPPGCGTFAMPAFDAGETVAWMERGKLGRSFHVGLGYDADGAGAAVARALQGEWARLGVDVELVPTRGAAAQHQALTAGPQLVLGESQPLLESPEAGLVAWIMPVRGPAVGALRTGWRTRDLDPWLWPGPRPAVGPFDPVAARVRLEQECIGLPLAELPWVWLVREGAPSVGSFHPRFGPASPRAAVAVPERLGR